MNKLFSAIVSAVVLFAACQKNEIAEPSRDGQVLYATIEDWSSTRTVLDEDNNIRWSEGDQIIGFINSTLGLKYQVTASSVGQTSASFDEVGSGGLNAGTELEHIIAYYPYSSAVKVAKSSADYALEVVLPSEQTYAYKSFGNGSFPMVAVSHTNNITFRNVCGGMKLQLKGTSKIASIKVEGKNNEKLSGKASVTAYTDSSKPSIVMADDASTSAVLNCGSGVQLNQDDATDFIISLPPTVFTKGFTITVTDVNGGAQVIETSKSNTVLRSSLLKMPVVTVEITTTPQEGDYVDEYGINHGQGIEIDGVVWAPVNCGYHATDFKYGKLYQWGRKYGQGYSGDLYDENGEAIGDYSDAIVPTIGEGGVSVIAGNQKSESNVFYAGVSSNYYDWVGLRNAKLWNSGTESDPVKTEYDPCPSGWRVPTYAELYALCSNKSVWTTNADGQVGFCFSGASAYTSDVPKVFFPAAGYRYPNDGDASLRGCYGFYWSSIPNYDYAYFLYFYSTYTGMTYGRGCAGGFSVRCVKDEAEFVPVVSVTIDKSSLSMEVGKTETISATITPSNANHNTAFWCSDNTDVAVVDQNGNVTAIAEGTANITAMAGMQVATCIVTVTSARVPQEGDYIDEYGINHGQGIEIDGVVWAPVNCGYHATDFKYGKLYQWGRKYGQGYDGVLYDSDGNEVGEYFDAITPSLVSGPVSLLEGESYSNSNFIYSGSDWLSTKNDKLWNLGVDETPIRTEYDPCPEGWRVPTYSELNQLSKHHSTWTIEGGQSGYWYCGSKQYSKDASQIFLPAAGHTLAHNYRGKGGYYWSSRPGHYYYDVSLLYFDNTTSDLRDYVRSYGFSIRCVKDEAEFVPVVSVTIDKSSLSMEVGKTKTISATITPSNANHNTVFWCSDNTDVAVVDQNGNVTAIAEGTANITAMAGMQAATCTVAVTSARVPQEGDYVDEYGINHGPGIKIGETVWAPVNCGYHATDFKYGKLYQWGRKYGQGYDGYLYDGNWDQTYSDSTTPTIKRGGVPVTTGNDKSNSNVFYTSISSYSYDWAYPSDDKLWNSGTEDNPVKTEYDPCPNGWRVPTYSELNQLSQNTSSWIVENVQNGYWFCGSQAYSTSVPRIFLPAAGYRGTGDGNADLREYYGNYWSSRTSGNYAVNLDFDSVSMSDAYRANGGSVRCVQESAESEGPVMYIGYLDGALNQQFNLSKDGIKNVYSNVTQEVIEAGINRGIIQQMDFESKGKTEYPSTPKDTISIFLIPYSSSMNVYIDNGIGGIVPFDHPDLYINGERIITLGNTDYKVYGEYESLNVFMENVNVSTEKFYYIQ